MRPTVKVSSRDQTKALREALNKIGKAQVLVGIPEEENDRRSGQIGNAGLLFVHTNGSPLRNIPARPVLEPAIQAPDNSAQISEQLKEAGRAVLEQNPVGAKQHLEMAGTLGANAAKRWFVDPRNHWAPNAPATIARKGSNRPLIDTAQMRRSITYLVKE